jgi:hypothetical protein
MPQVEDDSDDLIYQQDGAPPHYHHLVCGYLSQHSPQHCIRRTTTEDQSLLSGRSDRLSYGFAIFSEGIC